MSRHMSQASRGGNGEVGAATGVAAPFGQTLRAVLWSFFGVRKRADYESDVQRLDPRHVVIVGLAAAVLFVLVLVMLVKWVVGSGAAAG